MPCHDNYPIDNRSSELSKARNDLSQMEAMFCAAMTFIENTKQMPSFRGRFDPVETGMSWDELHNFWLNHKKKDKIRRLKEEKERREQEIRENALSKLNDEEKHLLGLTL